jgi:hypothetical protein
LISQRAAVVQNRAHCSQKTKNYGKWLLAALQSSGESEVTCVPIWERVDAEMDVLDVLADHFHRHFTELDLLGGHQYSVWAMITGNIRSTSSSSWSSTASSACLMRFSFELKPTEIASIFKYNSLKIKWWRRGESNPCPERRQRWHLHV